MIKQIKNYLKKEWEWMNRPYWKVPSDLSDVITILDKQNMMLEKFFEEHCSAEHLKQYNLDMKAWKDANPRKKTAGMSAALMVTC